MATSGTAFEGEESKVAVKKAAPASTFADNKYNSEEERNAHDKDMIEAEDRASHGDEAMYEGKNWRETVFVMFDEPESGILARIISLVVLVLILASSVSIVIETMRFVRISDKWQADLKLLEWICIIAFSVEYLLKAFTCSQRPGSSQSVARYLLGIMCLIDLFAILPFYFELAFGGIMNLAFLRALRMTVSMQRVFIFL